MKTALRSVTVAAALLAGARVASARDAMVTATTATTIYLDAGSADGLGVGGAWNVRIGGAELELLVVAVASHSAVVEIRGGAAPVVGAIVPLPPGLTPPVVVALRPGPAPRLTWRDDPAALTTVQRAAQREQAVVESDSTARPDRVRGEIALTAFIAGDAGNTSTSWQDLALSSQLEVVHGPWMYDHVLEGHLVGSPEIFYAPLQHATARLDIYLLRIAYSPAGARYSAALGRQPGAPLGELGSVDGARARVALGSEADLTVFGGLRPGDGLGLSAAPRAGADLGWQTGRGRGLHARADLGVAVDAAGGALDRAQTAGSLSVANGGTFVRGDAVVDLAADATERSGARLTRVSALARTRRGRLTTSAQAGYDRPFLDHALASALGDLAGLRLGGRTFGELDGRYALSRGLDVAAAARGTWGDGTWSGYGEVSAGLTRLPWRLSVAPHVVVGTLTDELGLRASLDVPVLRWQLGVGGSFDRVTAGAASAWAGIGRISASRPFLARWRTALSVEAAVGDGPPRLLGFVLLGYRIGD